MSWLGNLWKRWRCPHNKVFYPKREPSWSPKPTPPGHCEDCGANMGPAPERLLQNALKYGWLDDMSKSDSVH